MTTTSEPLADIHGGRDDQAPAAARSPLADIRARRDAARQQLHRDLAVPRIDPPIYVRFRPLTQAELDAAQKRHEKSKDAERTVTVNASLIAGACVGIFEVVDGNEVSVDPDDRDGDWPTFNPRLAQLLGLEQAPRAGDVVRGLYLTDGDVIATAAELTVWSGYSSEQLERDAQGN